MRSTRIISGVFIIILIFSLTQCCTTRNEIKQEGNNTVNKNNFAPRPLPPGSAKVTCTILNIFEKEGKNFCIVQIDTVHGYGPSTRPIGIGSKMELELNSNIENKSDNTPQNLFKTNSKYKFILSIFDNKFDKSDDKSWKIISQESIN